MTTIGILAVQGSFAEHSAAVAACGAEPRLIRLPADLEGISGLVLPGGESTAMERLLKKYELFEPLRTLINSGLPVYGSCAGMILLANQLSDGAAGQETLGGIDMTVRRNAFGRQRDSFEAHLDITGVTEQDAPLRAVFIRAPVVEQVGQHVQILASADSAAQPGRIVAVRQENLLATSFHPEVTGDLRVHQYFVDLARQAGK